MNLKGNSGGTRARRGIAGVLGALILFAIIFTAGAGFFLTVSSFNHEANQAQVARESSLQQVGLENLSLKAGITGGALYLIVNNTGGVPSTIADVFVTGASGNFVSTSSLCPATVSSHYLSCTNDLNVTLPLTLAVGSTTAKMSGCAGGPGCNIRINPASAPYVSGTTVLVSVLTSLGNVFSVQYPAPRLTTMKNVLVVNQVIVNQTNYGQLVVNDLNQSVVVGCYSCYTQLAAGGNILVTQLTATPSPVSDGGTIRVNATVWNYSPYTASGVTVTLSAIYAGSAYVSPDVSKTPGTCGSPASIGSGLSAKFVCTFVAHSGVTSGTVTFQGGSTGCDLTGNTTTCSGGASVTSAIAGSNPVQVGTLVSYGPWQLNYYYFYYTDSSHHTAIAPSVISSSDDYVALYVRLTNIYNTSMTLLDGSYLQFVSPGSDVNAYIVNSTNPSANSFTSFVCTDTPPSGPVGANCPKGTVPPGGTIILAFAACGAGLSSTSACPPNTGCSGHAGWEWSTCSPGGSDAGATVQIIVEYTLNHQGTYSIYAEDIPFQSVFIN